MRTVPTEKFQKIITDAIKTLPKSRQCSTNLYLNTSVYEEGALVGPLVQDIRTRRPSIVVFVDPEPLGNFSHKCRYRFYDPESQRFLYDTAAEFPPYVDRVPETYVAIHEPVRPLVRKPGHGVHKPEPPVRRPE
jgi:hypothetical protein